MRHPLFAEREEELRREAAGRVRDRRMHEVLGTRTFGPFEFEVWRDANGFITACRYSVERVTTTVVNAADWE